MQRTALILILLGLCFQSCGRPVQEWFDSPPFKYSSAKDTGGGAGYEGKTSYVSTTSDPRCESGIVERIEVHQLPQQAVRLRHDCQDIPAQPLDINRLDLLDHNPENLLHKHLYLLP